jgi:hypothetical protein
MIPRKIPPPAGRFEIAAAVAWSRSFLSEDRENSIGHRGAALGILAGDEALTGERERHKGLGRLHVPRAAPHQFVFGQKRNMLIELGQPLLISNSGIIANWPFGGQSRTLATSHRPLDLLRRVIKDTSGPYSPRLSARLPGSVQSVQ